MDQLFDAYLRNQKMINNLAAFVTEENRHVKPSEDGMALDEQLAHLQNTRRFWLSSTGSTELDAIGRNYRQVSEDNWVPIDSLDEMRSNLDKSAQAVINLTRRLLDEGATICGAYDHPLYFLQHMVWHDGYHFALIHLALRNAGVEISEDWEEANVWGLWRDESRLSWD